MLHRLCFLQVFLLDILVFFHCIPLKDLCTVYPSCERPKWSAAILQSCIWLCPPPLSSDGIQALIELGGYMNSMTSHSTQLQRLRLVSFMTSRVLYVTCCCLGRQILATHGYHDNQLQRLVIAGHRMGKSQQFVKKKKTYACLRALNCVQLPDDLDSEMVFSKLDVVESKNKNNSAGGSGIRGSNSNNGYSHHKRAAVYEVREFTEEEICPMRRKGSEGCIPTKKYSCKKVSDNPRYMNVQFTGKS